MPNGNSQNGDVKSHVTWGGISVTTAATIVVWAFNTFATQDDVLLAEKHAIETASAEVSLIKKDIEYIREKQAEIKVQQGVIQHDIDTLDTKVTQQGQALGKKLDEVLILMLEIEKRGQ